MQPAKYLNQILSSMGDGTGETSQNVASKDISAASTAAPVVCTSNAHGYVVDEYIFISGVTGMTGLNGLWQIASVPIANTFTVKTPGTGDVFGSVATAAGTMKSYEAFVYKPAATERAEIALLRGYAVDATYDEEKYFAVALTNGIAVKVYDNLDVELATLTATPVKTWLQWSLNGGAHVESADGIAGNETQGILEWDFTKANGLPISLSGSKGQFLVMIINDALDGLIEQQMSIQGEVV